jgi:hypothetical protein
MKRLKAHRWAVLTGVVGIALIAGAYFVGAASVDTHSAEIGDLEADATNTKSQLETTEAEVSSVEGDLSVAKGEVSVAEEEASEVREELAAERSFKGNGAKQQVAEREYDTDFPWDAAGSVGHFIFKPVAWEQDGEKWLLKIEAKNESHEPLSPFCGGGEAMIIDAENNNYSGESVLFSGSADCSGELQPGTTQTFEAEFKLPSNAAPVAAAIWGEYELQEEAKTWELPR